MTERAPAHIGNAKGRRATAIACLGLACLMVGAAFAAVPLYNLFCRVTGYDGTPLINATNTSRPIDRTVIVRFDTNVASGLPWTFKSEMTELSLRLGDNATVFFKVRNEGTRPAAAIATYNVQPGQAGAYFVKMKCFCFDEQVLKPGETMDFPVVFYVDPKMAEDKNLDWLSSITLSYTYFASRNGQPVTDVATRGQSQ